MRPFSIAILVIIRRCIYSIGFVYASKGGTGFQPSSIAIEATTPIFDKFARSDESHSRVLGKWSKLYVCKFIQEQSGVFCSLI